MDNKTHIRNAAQRISEFYDTLSRIAGVVKTEVETLRAQAAAPVAHQPEPENLDSALDELDTALNRLGEVGTTLSTIGGPTTGTSLPPTAPGNVSQTAARGTGPAENPGIPNAGAPSGATTPTGSQDLGPGGSRPIGGTAPDAFPTTLTGEEPRGRSAFDRRAEVALNTPQPVDANITTPGQTEERSGILGVGTPTPPEESVPAPPDLGLPEPEGVVPAGPGVAPPPPEQVIPAQPPSGGSVASQFTDEPPTPFVKRDAAPDEGEPQL